MTEAFDSVLQNGVDALIEVRVEAAQEEGQHDPLLLLQHTGPH